MTRVLTEDERRQKFETKWPEWKLIEYNGFFGPCIVKHQCGHEKCYQTYLNVEKRGPTCQNCVDTKKWYWNIGDIVDDLVIINRRALPNTLQEYQYKCNKCGFDGSKPAYLKGEYISEYWVIGHGIKCGNRCACCRGVIVQPGINDVTTTDPDIVPYFANSEDAARYSRGSEVKIQSKCPICDYKDDRLISVSNLVNEGRACLNCGNSVSYPEKLMYFLLKEINVQFEMHKVFEWSKSVYDIYDGLCHKREYDFYIPSINTIIEMHGSQHYKNTFIYNKSYNEQYNFENRQRIDKDKKELAIRYGYKYIIIDCNNSNKSYISNNILQSNLAKIYDLSMIDWNKISRKALSGISKLVIQDKEMNPSKSTVDLAEEYGVHFSTVIRWLKKAGMYDISQEQKNAGIKRSYPVYSPELDKAFRTMKFASNEIGVSAKGINTSVLSSYPKKSHAGKHPVTKQPLTWEKWTIEQYEEWCNNTEDINRLKKGSK